MKRLIIIFSIFCFCLPAMCQGLAFDILDLKEDNDSLLFRYNTLVTPHAVRTGQSLRITPMLESGNFVMALPGVTVLGNNRRRVMKRMKHLPDEYIRTNICSDTVFETAFRIPYKLWMDSASLVVEERLTGYRARTTTTRYRLNNSVSLSTRAPYEVSPVVAFILPDKEVKVRHRQGKAYLDFPVGRSVILPTYRRNPEELSKIDDALRDVMGNSDVTIQGIYIEGYASPEGTYASNDRLSKARAEALREYIVSKFPLNSSLFKVSNVAEDWDGLVELVNASDMAQKEQVLKIIETIGIFGGRESALMRLNGGVPYLLMLKEMFPELRRVEYQVDYTVKDYDLPKTLVVLQKNPADLSQLELYNLAFSSEKWGGDFNRIFVEVIPRYFSDDAVANNNAAAVLIQGGELATAKRFLQRAGQSAAALNNLGVMHLLEGDLEEAESCFAKARDAGCNESIANLEEVKAKRDDNKKQERYKNRK
ncbi:OmpA family protein [Bacteroides thetaiotaomicron]|uniref:OmpA family protein n=1 Tax=Bacteroides thetaiotaomicron TaxID=818 RepID=UPI0018A05F91|nr:OmpA family protein [Bacteroides thetaiotaomicron]MDC2172659.1 OmpA family protein [Bacteroides thetaiotaomicron]MDC2187887.1 OmpA family protein [Bacteroides thetaiotaomicron]